MHALSLALAGEVPTLTRHLPHGVVGCRVVSPGLVKLELRAGAPTGYGRRKWPFLIGGAGLGDSAEIVERMGGTPRAPVCARFGVPIAMEGVDDAGCVDSSFWDRDPSEPHWDRSEPHLDPSEPHSDPSEPRWDPSKHGTSLDPDCGSLRQSPTLHAIALRAVAWLQGDHLPAKGGEGDEARERWAAAERLMSTKLESIEQYRKMVKHPQLFPPPIPPRVSGESPRVCGESPRVCGESPRGESSESDSWNARFSPEWLAQPLRALAACESAAEQAAAAAAVVPTLECIGRGIYSMPFFTREFCRLLLDEVDGYVGSGLPRRAPNSMNRHGLILNEIGLEPLMGSLLRRVLSPLALALYSPAEPFASSLDHHHSFVVAYAAAEGGDKVGLSLAVLAHMAHTPSLPYVTPHLSHMSHPTHLRSFLCTPPGASSQFDHQPTLPPPTPPYPALTSPYPALLSPYPALLPALPPPRDSTCTTTLRK